MAIYGSARPGPEQSGGYVPPTYGYGYGLTARGRAPVVPQRGPDSSELDGRWQLVPSDLDVGLAIEEFFYRQELLFKATETLQDVNVGSGIQNLIQTLGDKIPQGAVMQAKAAWIIDPRRGKQTAPWLVINVGMAPDTGDDPYTVVNLSLSATVPYRPDLMETLRPDELDPYVIYMGVAPHPDAGVSVTFTQAVYEIAKQ